MTDERRGADGWTRRAGRLPWWACETPAAPECLAAVSTRLGGVSEPPWASLNLSARVGDDPARVAENRLRLRRALGLQHCPWRQPQQVHGSQVGWLDSPRNGTPTADGLLTGCPDVVLCVLVADCVPLLVAAPRAGVVGAVHIGWRGLVAGIVASLFATLRARSGSVPAECWFLLGPSIDSCCYPVGWELADPFRRRWGEGVVRPGRDPQRPHLSVPEAVRRELIARGAAPERILASGLCTACQTADFYSHRRDGGRTGRQAGLIVWRGERPPGR